MNTVQAEDVVQILGERIAKLEVDLAVTKAQNKQLQEQIQQQNVSELSKTGKT